MMVKRIIANEDNLYKALRATAIAHEVQFADWMDDGQVGIRSEGVPLVADVRSIVSAFCSNSNSIVEVGYDYTTIYLDEAVYRKEVNELGLQMALPYSNNINWETK